MINIHPIDHLSPFVAAVAQEVECARHKHPIPICSLHEGFAIILEEVDELKGEVWKRHRERDALLMELVQVAAMCQRMAEDCELTSTFLENEKGRA